MLDAAQKEDLARSLFLQGYNCAQSVFAAFAEEMGLEQKQALRLASALGGGMGGMRGVCGAVSGMLLVLGMLKGYDQPGNHENKKRLYAQARDMAQTFRGEFGALNCGELLSGAGIQPKAEPSDRTAAYYRERPCARYVAACARLTAEELQRGA